jgi:hypothetical protein
MGHRAACRAGLIVNEAEVRAELRVELKIATAKPWQMQAEIGADGGRRHGAVR